MDRPKQITLRNALISDIPLLREWDEKPHIREIDPYDDWDWENEVPVEHWWRKQLVAELDGKAIGFIQIIDPYHEESHYWGDIEENLRAIDIWIGEEDEIGKGYGTQMMNQAIDICFSDKNVKSIVIDPLVSNKKAIRFYEKIGFKFLRYQSFGPDDCYIMILDR